MTDDETAFTLVRGLRGRLSLSGFLDVLRPEQRARVAEAVALHKRLRDGLTRTTPFWPLGLPAWDSATVCLGLSGDDGDLLFVWDRDAAPAAIEIPGVSGAVEVLFPAGDGAAESAWGFTVADGRLSLATPAGIGARVLRVTRG
jgi:alpha-galactosidase